MRADLVRMKKCKKCGAIKPSTHQKMLDRQLDLALRGSDSLNGRGTTLAGLLGATIAVVAAASVEVIGHVDELPTSSIVAIASIFGFALAALGLCVGFALAAVRPNTRSSARIQTVVDQLMSDVFDEHAVRRSTWLALNEQRQANDRKSGLMRVAYVLAAIGIVAVVVANATYCIVA
jgi:hypothetical protein